MADLLIKNGEVVNADGTVVADVLIRGEKIEKVASSIEVPDDIQVIDALGKLVLPGGIDPHTHFDLPMFETVSADDHYTGHKAAAFGGTTTVMDFIPQTPGMTLKSDVDLWHQKADSKAAIDWSFHMNITQFDARVAQEIPTLLDAGIASLKVFTAYNHRLRLQDREIFQLMQLAKEHNMLTMLHAENGDVIEVLVEQALSEGHSKPIWHARTRPAWGAVESVLRASSMAAQTEAPLYIVHMNTAGGLDQLNYARDRGVPVMGETCPQYLLFTEENLLRKDASKWIASPPLRNESDNNALWQGLSDNQFQVIGSDHCPFFFDGSKPIEYEGQQVSIPGKELGVNDFTKIPNGLPMVGDRLPLIWTAGVDKGKITAEQFVAQTSTNAARIFGIFPQKGVIRAGSDADLLIIDPENEVDYGVALSQHRTDYNLFEGWKIKGIPEKVFSRGEMIVDQGKWLGRMGRGKFLARNQTGETL
jgi:dihydropyrimidinase